MVVMRPWRITQALLLKEAETWVLNPIQAVLMQGRRPRIRAEACPFRPDCPIGTPGRLMIM